MDGTDRMDWNLLERSGDVQYLLGVLTLIVTILKLFLTIKKIFNLSFITN